jgi:hypothetical protein
MRIGEEPAPTPWRGSWALVSAAVACAAMLIVAGSAALAPIDRASVPRLVARVAAVIPPINPVQLAVTVAASRRPRNMPTRTPPPQLRAVMTANAETSAAVREHFQQEDYDALLGDADTYQQNFTYLQGFWGERDADRAVDISRAGVAAAAALAAAARAGDAAAVERAIAAIFGTCGACHRQYREELPDGGYEIRL